MSRNRNREGVVGTPGNRTGCNRFARAWIKPLIVKSAMGLGEIDFDVLFGINEISNTKSY